MKRNLSKLEIVQTFDDVGIHSKVVEHYLNRGYNIVSSGQIHVTDYKIKVDGKTCSLTGLLYYTHLKGVE